MLKQVINVLWAFKQFYLKGGIIGGDGSESVPLPSASAHLDTRVLQL